MRDGGDAAPDVQSFGYFGSDPALRDVERHLQQPGPSRRMAAANDWELGFLLGMFGSGH
jgi:hypothetical protein